jgi:release factor glutamine methyltransferase
MPFNSDQVYVPEADTYLMLDAARAEVKAGDRVLEIGTGSGTIAAELVWIANVVATDINPHAVFCARKKGVNVIQSDLFSGIRGTFDLVIFNPPYLPTQPEERIDDWLEYALDGGVSGRDVIEKFVAEVGTVLSPGGRVLLLISSLTGLPEVRDLFTRQGFTSEIVLKKKVEDETLYVLKINRIAEKESRGSGVQL